MTKGMSSLVRGLPSREKQERERHKEQQGKKSEEQHVTRAKDKGKGKGKGKGQSEAKKARQNEITQNMINSNEAQLGCSVVVCTTCVLVSLSRGLLSPSPQHHVYFAYPR